MEFKTESGKPPGAGRGKRGTRALILILGCLCLLAACAPYADDDYWGYPHRRVYYREHYYRGPYTYYGYTPRRYYYRPSPNSYYYRDRVYDRPYYRPYFYGEGRY